MFISAYENSTNVAGFSEVENMLRLQKCLKGKAYDMVKDKLLLPSMVPDVINTLKTFFGRPDQILEHMINKTKKMFVHKDKLESLIDFSLAVRNVCATMEACKLHAHLNNPMLVKELVDKLPTQQKLNWAMYQRDESIPAIKSFSDWLYKIAEAASTITSSATMGQSHAVLTHKEYDNSPKPRAKYKECMMCTNRDHHVSQCQQFINLNVSERDRVVREHKACFKCLNNHSRRCTSTKECGINGCESKHHPLLHKGSQASHLVSTHNTTDNGGEQFFRILPVKLYGKNSVLETYAFLDEGSSVTLIDEAALNKLNIRGKEEPLCLQWTSETTRMEETSTRASVQISGMNCGRKHWLNNVRSVKNIALPQQTINMATLTQKFRHLIGIPLQSYSNAVPMLLIGTNNWKLAVPRKLREGKWNDPIASKCMLGWGLQGGLKSTTTASLHHCECNWGAINEAVKKGFKPDAVTPRTLSSPEDEKAVNIMNNSCIKINGHFQVGLLWRDEKAVLPDSYTTAAKRLDCLKAKIAKNPELYVKIQTQIDNLVNKNYAIELSSEELTKPTNRIWYLPIFIALNPNKPNKVRLVWDAAAKSHGKSLNDFMMNGPDYLNPLTEVLMAFRIGSIAVYADIAEMFHQINIQESDMHAQRFLWYDKDTNKTKIFVMRAMTFGICCAPCIAHYVRIKNAEPYQQQYPRAYEAISYAHYVDDYIDSLQTEDEAIEVATQVRNIHTAGGFHIRNWASNSTKLLKQLQDENDAILTAKNLGDPEKVLGMCWEPLTDVFKYMFRFARLRRNILADELIPTKREVLQVLMSVFDPLGFLACHTIGLKILLQRVWSAGIDWDDELTEPLTEAWHHWKRLLPQIATIEVPRHYSPFLKDAEQVALHTFVDASEHAYAAVCYLRVCKAQHVDVTLVAAKNKVAPLKPLSIPRMELLAALTGVRLAAAVMNTRGLKIDSCTYWSDSRTVLHWMTMNPRNFHPFVMHRIGEIVENSNVAQWHWVPSKQNPADLATKFNIKPDTNRWLCGPPFLKQSEDAWPKSATNALIDVTDDSEVRKYALVMHETKHLKLNVEYFSDWRRLYRATATFLLYLKILRSKRTKEDVQKVITPELVTTAKTMLCKHAQTQTYLNELHALRAHKAVDKSSALIALNVYLDKDDIIRVQGRAEKMNCNEDAIVLPKDSHIAHLIVKHFHTKNHHLFHETVINIIRGEYYIPKLRVLYKIVRKTCQRCKINSATPQVPQMAPLPAARITSHERPFTFTGVDFFGPMLVTVGRRREKRWGVLFTCLTIRAIHIEISHSLDTSSCVMCINNFMSRRGPPKEFYSDNGTNLKAAAKTLKEEMKVNFGELVNTYDSIKWHFNPPGAPHMGGAWERLIRSVKTVLKAVYPTCNYNDEGLRSALMEAEYIIKSRPLTFVSVDAEDDDALTPNHLLLGSPTGYKPMAVGDMNLRQRWRQTQLFADRFWQRWVKEYAPTLVRRSKWFNKQPPLAVNDIVIVVDENLPRNCWPKGRIIGVVTAKDGQVRRATVKTQHGSMERPVAKIAVLDVGGKE